jgi:hypothetical protein
MARTLTELCDYINSLQNDTLFQPLVMAAVRGVESAPPRPAPAAPPPERKATRKRTRASSGDDGGGDAPTA